MSGPQAEGTTLIYPCADRKLCVWGTTCACCGSPPRSDVLGCPPHLLRGVHVQLAAGKVVEEEHRLRAAGHNVVHAHGHQVDAHLQGPRASRPRQRVECAVVGGSSEAAGQRGWQPHRAGKAGWATREGMQ